MSNSRGRAPSAAAAGVPAVMTRTELATLTTAEKSQHKHPAHFEGTKVIVVGVGLWGSNIAREAYRQNALAAIVDPCEAAMTHLLEALEKPVDVPKFRTLHEALSKVQSSPVVVATPPKTHFEVAMAAIVAHRDVWVEKPVCTSVGDAQRLVAAAKKNDVILFVDHLMHYNLAHEKLLRLVGAGWVGEITRVRAKRLNFGRVRIAENVLWSFCPHDVSLIIAICGGRLPVSVYCVGQSVVSSDIEDYVDLHLEFPGGIRASLEANWLHYEKERRMEVFGRSGCIVVNESCKELRKPELQGFKWSTKRNRDGSSVAIDKSEQDMMGYLAGTASMVTPNTVAGAVTDAPSGAEGAGAAADAAASVGASGGVNAASVATAHGAAGASVATTAAPVLGNGAATEQAATGNTTDLKSTPLQTAMQHFLKCCKTRETPRTDGVEGLNVLKVLVAAQESLKKKRAVVLDGVEKKRVESSNMYFKHPTAVVDSGAHIGEHTRIWHFSHIMGGARLGKGCNIGQNVYIGGKVILGNNVKVQNGVSIYDGVTVDDDAFLGPHCVFTNIKTPRSHINRRKEYLSTWVGRGASIGANATLMCGISLSDYCLVGAGSVVTKNVPSHAMVYGNPAVIKGWVSTTGNGLVVVAKIGDGRRILQCPESKEVYTLFPAPRAGADPHIVREVGDDEQK